MGLNLLSLSDGVRTPVQGMGLPMLEWVSPPQSTHSRNFLTDMPEVCVWGDTGSITLTVLTNRHTSLTQNSEVFG